MGGGHDNEASSSYFAPGFGQCFPDGETQKGCTLPLGRLKKNEPSLRGKRINTHIILLIQVALHATPKLTGKKFVC